MRQKFPGINLNAKHIMNKMKRLKDKYSAAYDMLNTSGFGWDDALQCVTVDAQVLEEYLKKHPSKNYIANKPFPQYERLTRIFGKDRATGSLAESAADAMENINLESEVGADTDEFVGPFPTPSNGASASHIPQEGETSSKKRKRKANDSENMYKVIASGLNSLSEEVGKLVEVVGTPGLVTLNEELEKLGFDDSQCIALGMHFSNNPVQLRYWSTLADRLKQMYAQSILGKLDTREFIGIAHVPDTSSSTLKEAIVSMLANHQLSIDQVRGQGYDGASNMRGEFNGLRAMILRDNPSAHYIHCFAHQLQLVIVAVAKKHEGVKDFFEYLNMVVTTVSASYKRKDMIREAKRKRVADGIRSGEIKTGKELNQESSLLRSGDTRWGSHHATIVSVLKLFREVVDVLCYVKEEGDSTQQRSSAKGILSYFKKLEFIFNALLMQEILGLTNSLSKHLQKKNQDLLEASKLINGTKQALNDLRQNGFEDLMKKVTSFCETNHIEVLDMMGSYGNPRNRRNVVTNRHHFEVEIFNTILDMQIQELGNRFNEESTTLMYPVDFTMNERACILGELKVFYYSAKEDERFAKLDGMGHLARLMVETGKDLSFPLFYRILKLALVLPVSTATVERCFSKMKLIKADLRNRMGDEYLNNAMVCAVERETFDEVTNEDVMERFKNMKDRRGEF
ncbi:hypothetical protein OSB04_021272 [Centaurea solstitialis]|uniref:Uncharacterized protein n=1 Tax=Centaurea solstitialis TaxID=347529 RepID=A0AA38STW1_9ASTR|nr:hypothetical protein OSB04_021272 [Centaurea solstitialis]